MPRELTAMSSAVLRRHSKSPDTWPGMLIRTTCPSAKWHDRVVRNYPDRAYTGELTLSLGCLRDQIFEVPVPNVFVVLGARDEVNGSFMKARALDPLWRGAVSEECTRRARYVLRRTWPHPSFWLFLPVVSTMCVTHAASPWSTAGVWNSRRRSVHGASCSRADAPHSAPHGQTPTNNSSP